MSSHFVVGKTLINFLITVIYNFLIYKVIDLENNRGECKFFFLKKKRISRRKQNAAVNLPLKLYAIWKSPVI